MISVLRVCLSSELPPASELLSNYFYFLYDRLILYKGSEKVDSNYSISVDMPENPVPYMFYILHDGTIHQYIDYTDTLIANIEDPAQIPNIAKAGTTYFINSDSRYIDKHDRTLVMPFNSETYELVVNYRDEDKFDNDTIVKFNEETGQFELYSGEEKYEEYSKEIKGKDTASVHTYVSGSRLSSEIKLSQAFGNALRALSDGLFIRSDDKVNKEDFDQYYRDFKDLKSYCYAILDNLETQIEFLKGIISKDAINEEIHNQLVSEYPAIDEALENYDYIRDNLDAIETAAMSYATTNISAAIVEVEEGLQQATEWDNLTENIDEYENEVNYYDKSNAWDNELGNIGLAAVAVGLEKYNNDFDFVAAIATSIEMYNSPDCTNKEMAAVATALEMYNIPEEDNSYIAAIATGIEMFNHPTEPDAFDIAAVASGLDLYESEVRKDFASIGLGIRMYEEV